MIVIKKNKVLIEIKSEESLFEEIKNLDNTETIFNAIKIKLSENKSLSDEATYILGNFIRKNFIKEINFSGSNISDESIKNICVLLDKVHFGIKLNLNNCSLSDKGAKYLGKYLHKHFMKLDSLDIGSNEIGFVGYYHIRKIVKSKLSCDDNKGLTTKFGKTLLNIKNHDSTSDALKSLCLSLRNKFKLDFSFTRYEEYRIYNNYDIDGRYYPELQKVTWRDYGASPIDWTDFSDILGSASIIESYI